MSDPGQLRTLLAEIAADRGAMDEHARHLTDSLASGEKDYRANALVAVSIHHWYSALEAIFERVARTFEGPPPKDERWHQELLHRMTLPIEDVRPLLVRAALSADLRELLGFRHFFRHAYVVSFDRERLERAAGVLMRCHPEVSSDLEHFAQTIRIAVDGA